MKTGGAGQAGSRKLVEYREPKGLRCKSGGEDMAPEGAKTGTGKVWGKAWVAGKNCTHRGFTKGMSQRQKKKTKKKPGLGPSWRGKGFQYGRHHIRGSTMELDRGAIDVI